MSEATIHTTLDYLLDEITWKAALPGDNSQQIAAYRAQIHDAVRVAAGAGDPHPNATRDEFLRDLWNGDIPLSPEQRTWIRQAIDAQEHQRFSDGTPVFPNRVGAGDPPEHNAVHREESIMAEKCPWSDNGAHHYVAVIEQEVRTTTGETTTATYTQSIFCVQCGHKL